MTKKKSTEIVWAKLSDKQIHNIVDMLHMEVQFYLSDGLAGNDKVLREIEKALRKNMYRPKLKASKP
jgi:hypothetical protein